MLALRLLSLITFPYSFLLFRLYFSPEIHLQQPYSKATDIYSLGVVFLELLTLKQLNPFMSYSSLTLQSDQPITYDQHLQTCIDQVPQQYSQDIRELLAEMLHKVSSFHCTFYTSLHSLLITLSRTQSSVSQSAVSLRSPRSLPRSILSTPSDTQ